MRVIYIQHVYEVKLIIIKKLLYNKNFHKEIKTKDAQIEKISEHLMTSIRYKAKQQTFQPNYTQQPYGM